MGRKNNSAALLGLLGLATYSAIQRRNDPQTSSAIFSGGRRIAGWVVYATPDARKLSNDKCGKWMCFFNDFEHAKQICQKAIDENACAECKCTDVIARGTDDGVICFYANGDDFDAHKRIIKFMMDNDLIRRTKTGKYYNISFKYDRQTQAGEYGALFEGQIKLDKYVDLKTGKFIV